MNKKLIQDDHIVVFSDKTIRRVFYDNTWWFVVTDIITALTDTINAPDYIKNTKPTNYKKALLSFVNSAQSTSCMRNLNGEFTR